MTTIQYIHHIMCFIIQISYIGIDHIFRNVYHIPAGGISNILCILYIGNNKLL